MPEQVYDPNYDVWYMPSDGGDNSGSGSTPLNAQSLIDNAKNSKEEDRDSNWWTDMWSNIGNWFKSHTGWFKSNGYGLKDVPNNNVKNAVLGAVNGAPGAWLAQSVVKKSGIPNASDIQKELNKSDPISLEKVQKLEQEKDLTDMKSLQDLFWNVYNQYNADTQQRADAYNAMMKDYFENYYQYQVEGLKKAGINPLLALQSISSPGLPNLESGRVSTYSPGSILSSYASQLGQDKKLGSDFLKILVSLLGILAQS